MATRFSLGVYGLLILLRAIPGLLVIAFAGFDRLREAGACLVLSVWMDALLGWQARKNGWTKDASHVQIDGFVDFVCFIWAPVQFVFGQVRDPFVYAASGIFILSGIYRLARFNVEDLVGGGYRGLPVTYNGYIFPAATLTVHYIQTLYVSYLYLAVFIVLSILMASGSFVTPEL